MSIRFSEVKLTAVTADETVIEHQYIYPGHPDKEMIRGSLEFRQFCENNSDKVAVSADVAMYITGHTAETRDADEDHIKLICAYEADSGRRFVKRNSVDCQKCVTYFYAPPFEEVKRNTGDANEC